MQQPELDRIEELERAGKIVVTRTFVTLNHGPRLSLTNPRTRSSVVFFPRTGTITRDNVKQFRKGLEQALKLIGVQA